MAGHITILADEALFEVALELGLPIHQVRGGETSNGSEVYVVEHRMADDALCSAYLLTEILAAMYRGGQ